MHERRSKSHKMCCQRVRAPRVPTSQAGTVTNHSFDSIDDLNKHCIAEFRKHWQCLDNNNHQLWNCRNAERALNKCAFDSLVSILDLLHVTLQFTNVALQKLEKTIPGTPEGEEQVHLRRKQIFAMHSS